MVKCASGRMLDSTSKSVAQKLREKVRDRTLMPLIFGKIAAYR